MAFDLLLKTIEYENQSHYLISGILIFVAPLIGIGLPIACLRFVPKERRGAWLRGMLAIGLPALVVCVIVATNLAPLWSGRTYIQDINDVPKLQRDAPTLASTLLRSAILGGGTALLIFIGGWVNNRLTGVEE